MSISISPTYGDVRCCTLMYVAVRCCTLLYVAVRCCTLLYLAVRCCTLLYVACLSVHVCKWGEANSSSQHGFGEPSQPHTHTHKIKHKQPSLEPTITRAHCIYIHMSLPALTPYCAHTNYTSIPSHRFTPAPAVQSTSTTR